MNTFPSTNHNFSKSDSTAAESDPKKGTASLAANEATAGDNEASNSQKKWNAENLEVPRPQSVIVSSTIPKDNVPSVEHSFSKSDAIAIEDAAKKRAVPPSTTPPTNSLRIDHFLRPFTIRAAKELLGKTGTVTSFWMDNIESYCYVTYSCVEEAMETRNAVYNLQWPPHDGHHLVAEFVEPHEVKKRMDHASPPPSPPACLDSLFKKTKATPHIYYLPLTDEEVMAKLKEKG